jgi:hypothetical protein
MDDDLKITAKRDRVLEWFVIDHGDIFEVFGQEMASAPELILPVARTFADNLRSALAVAQIPFSLTHTAELQARFQGFLTAARIRALAPPEGSGASRPDPFETAQGQMKASLAEPKFREAIAKSVVDQLYSLSEEAELNGAFKELRLETVVMIWGGFEVFITEALRRYVNAYPAAAAKLSQDELAKRHFGIKAVSIDTLASHNFNVAGAMGDLLLSERRLDALPIMKDVLKSVFEFHGPLIEVLGSAEMWRLAQRRHLIVHRRGRIDAAYLANTGDTFALGEQLDFTGDYILSSAKLVTDAAIEVINAARQPPS